MNVIEEHLESVLKPITTHFRGQAGEKFLTRFITAFKTTESPIVINLDHNVSSQSLDEANDVVTEIATIVKASAKHVAGYKMNFQSLLTFLIAGRPKFVSEIKAIYKKINGVDPVVWLDQKLGDIPNTNYQSATILYKLGFDAVHGLPQIGPDCMGAIQMAAEENDNAGVIHVVNLTHDGYNTAKKDYFKGESTIDKLRERTLGDYSYPVKTSEGQKDVLIKAVGTIEPANRPYELYQGYKSIYKDKIMIISIGIGPQGALPGCALYAGATLEGIGRFIFEPDKTDTPKSVANKSKICKECAIIALKAKYENSPYPLTEILQLLKDYNPTISDKIKSDLNQIHKERR